MKAFRVYKLTPGPAKTRRAWLYYTCAVIALLPVFAPPARASYISEIKFQESLEAYKKGDYKNAMLGFMDVVVVEPKNDLARNYLKESGRKILESEAKSIQLRSKNILADSETMKKRLDSLNASKAVKIREWDGAFSRVKSLAGDADSLREAVSAYEEFVRKTPVYAELLPVFSEREEIIRSAFYAAIKGRYPEMVKDKTSIDEADLAVVFIEREAVNEFSYRHVNTGQTESILAKSSQIKSLLTGVSALFDSETRALELYSGGKFAQADALFRKVLKARGANEEAVFYSGLVTERVAAALAARPAANEAEARPCSGDLCPRSGIAAAKPDSRTIELVALPFVAPPTRGALTPPGQIAPAPGENDSRPVPGVKAAAPVLNQAQSTTGGIPNSRKAVPPVLEPQSSEAAQADAIEAADKLYELGVREFSIGNYKGAAAKWGECLRINPDHSKAKLGLERLKSAL